jgi:hypothetical protein
LLKLAGGVRQGLPKLVELGGHGFRLGVGGGRDVLAQGKQGAADAVGVVVGNVVLEAAELLGISPKAAPLPLSVRIQS